MARHISECGTQVVTRESPPGVADILRRARDEGHIDVARLTRERAKVLHAICCCRTAVLGGHARVCEECGGVTLAYNSCRNRHCPQCQWGAARRWIEGRVERLLDTHYFHVVFTLPGDLRPLALLNPKELYALLFKSASQTLLELGRDPKYLGADLGVTMVLHTWQRDLALHPHVHCLVTGGGLTPDGRWKSARRRYLFPVKVMSALFRGKFLAGLRRLHDEQSLREADIDVEALLGALYRKNWVVFAKRPMAGPRQVIKYLGQYTHRVAISDHRILGMTEDSVTFTTRRPNQVTLPLAEFARRFVLHVLPAGFVKTRHYGLFAAANIRTKWAAAHALRPVAAEPPNEVREEHVACCERCGSANLIRIELRAYETVVVIADAYHVVNVRGPPKNPHHGGVR